MRGKRRLVTDAGEKTRITPAGAGKTMSRTEDKAHEQDHPRRCGENRYLRIARTEWVGSPPQVRGKLAYPNRIPSPRRITPAGAGKTVMALVDITSLQDHPRRCGENPLTQARRVVCIGSPPQVRGKLDINTLLDSFFRITPADAGKTRNRACAARQARDHPRGCGENVFCVSNDGFARGSPPRMRGKLRTGDYSYVAVRITPADAGKTTALRALVSGD